MTIMGPNMKPAAVLFFPFFSPYMKDEIKMLVFFPFFGRSSNKRFFTKPQDLWHFSTAVAQTAVLIQTVGSEQKLQDGCQMESGQLDFGLLDG